MIPFGLSSLMTVSMPIGRRTTKCLIPGASAIYLCNEGAGDTLTDFSGNALDGMLGNSAGADAYDPTWGTTGLAFGAAHWVNCGTVAGLEVGSQDHTLQIVCTPLEAAATSIPVFGKIALFANEWGIYVSATGRFAARSRDGAASTSAVAPVACVPNAPCVISAVRSGTALDLYVGSSKVATETIPADRAPATSAKKFGIGGQIVGASLPSDVHAGVVYPFALSAAQLAQNNAVFQALLSRRGLTLSLRAAEVVAIGDSITYGAGISGVTVATAYPYVLQLSAGRPVVNAGVGGNTTTQMLARLPELLTRYAPDIVTILGGTNDLFGPESAATIEANLAGMVAAVNTTGARAVLLTIPPSSTFGAPDSTTNTTRTAVNAWIAGQAGAAAAVADVADALKDPATPTNLLAAYDSGDHQHPNAAGLAIIADTVYAAMQGA